MGETRRPEGAAMLATRRLKRNAQITDGKGIFTAMAGEAADRPSPGGGVLLAVRRYPRQPTSPW
jgi:hypothetical protein